MIRLRRRNKVLTAQIHTAGYRPINAAKQTPLFKKKKAAEACLNFLKTKLRSAIIKRARKRYFRKADTVNFESQFSVALATQTSSGDAQCAKPIEYHLPEPAAVVRLTCSPADSPTEQKKFSRRIRAIEARAALFDRQETRSRRRPEPRG